MSPDIENNNHLIFQEIYLHNIKQYANITQTLFTNTISNINNGGNFQPLTNNKYNTTNSLNIKNIIKLNMPGEKIFTLILLCLLIVITVIGNTLIIVAVISTRRLRTVTNCFVMSLAVADWLVGIFVMPPAAWLFVTGNNLLIIY